MVTANAFSMLNLTKECRVDAPPPTSANTPPYSHSSALHLCQPPPPNSPATAGEAWPSPWLCSGDCDGKGCVVKWQLKSTRPFSQPPFPPPEISHRFSLPSGKLRLLRSGFSPGFCLEPNSINQQNQVTVLDLTGPTVCETEISRPVVSSHEPLRPRSMQVFAHVRSAAVWLEWLNLSEDDGC